MQTRRAVLTLLASACVLAGGAARAQDRLKVVASFSILGDLVRAVGGDRIELDVLVGPDGDAHVFAPSPADARRVGAAQVVIVNGLGFEGWVERLVRASGFSGRLVTASAGVAARPADEEAHGHSDHGHRDRFDPHAWQSVDNVRRYVESIRDGLIAADPEGRPTYEGRARAYLAELEALDREIRDTIARIPAERRRIITSHDAFGYFGAAYGLDFVAPQGLATDAEASARDVAQLIRQIRREKARAVFVENISDPRLIRRIADETGARIGGTLYSDALSGPEGPAGTYLAMMRHNIGTIAAALAD